MASPVAPRRSARIAARAAMAAQPAALQAGPVAKPTLRRSPRLAAAEKAAPAAESATGPVAAEPEVRKELLLPATLNVSKQHDRDVARIFTQGFLTHVEKAKTQADKIYWSFQLFKYLCAEGSILFMNNQKFCTTVNQKLDEIEKIEAVQIFPRFLTLIVRTRFVIRIMNE